jgi:hypothetical protein
MMLVECWQHWQASTDETDVDFSDTVYQLIKAMGPDKPLDLPPEVDTHEDQSLVWAHSIVNNIN